MQPSFSGPAFSGTAIQRFTSVSPVWSADSAQGGLLFFGLTFLTAALGALASSSAPSFYAALQLPSWAPPASVFGPVWTVLYAVMAVAAWVSFAGVLNATLWQANPALLG